MLREQTQEFFTQIQSRICRQLEALDGGARFSEDHWQHPQGGGGLTRVIAGGAIFEKGGVNTSAVNGMLSESIAQRLRVEPQGFFATGISLVLHPLSPMIPTVHMNLRFLQLDNGDAWFGGGTDLTPFYLFEEDVRHFHRTLKAVCDRHNPEYYSKFKNWCDEYFFIRHRAEARGVGGLFFDYQRDDLDSIFAFVRDLGEAFLDAYVPIVERRRSETWGQREKEWHLIRRGRYAEFNLVYDRGTLFGLETQGRTESILMSLPPEVKWVYNHAPEEGSEEQRLLDVLKKPKDWV